MVRTTKQWIDANQLEVEDRVQTKWTEKDLRERAGALRSAHIGSHSFCLESLYFTLQYITVYSTLQYNV